MRQICCGFTAVLLVVVTASVVRGQEKKKPPPTQIEAQQDTLRATPKSPSAKKQAAPNLEIPDVMIYGRDTVKRIVGRKLTPDMDSLQVVSPPVSFERRQSERSDYPKRGFEFGEAGARRTWVRALGGKFTTFSGDLVHWNQYGPFDYNLEAGVGRSNGQFTNSEYTRADLGGSVGVAAGHWLEGSIDASLGFHDYGLHGAVFPDRDRQIRSGILRSRWLWTPGTETEVEISGEAGALDLEPQPVALESYLGTSANRWVRAKGRLAWGPSQGRFSLAGELVSDHFENDVIQGHDVRIGSVWGAGSVAFSRALSLFITLGLQNENVEGDTKTFLAPQAKALLQVSPRFGFHAAAGRELRYENFALLLNESPYISVTTTLRPEEIKAYLELGFEYKISGELTLVGLVRNERIDQYGYWQRVDSTGLFDYPRLNDVGLTQVGGGLRVAVPAGLSAEARLVILDDRRGAPGSTESFDVPYRERYQVPFRLAYHPNDRIQLSTTSTWVSSRRVALTEDTTLPAYWLIDAELEYRLVPAIGLVVSGKNLTDRKYSVWQGYPATGVLISGGVTARW